MSSRGRLIALTAALVALATTGCGATTAPSGSSTSGTTSAQTTSGTSAAPGGPSATTSGASRSPGGSNADAGTAAQVAAARAMLDKLPVGGRGPKTGYDREVVFGAAWADVDGNGCGTRDDMLTRDLTNPTRRSRCVVIAGTLADPYTGRQLTFSKEQASKVQIDHVVPLSLAWQLGAAQWPQGKRVAFANDPINLLAVDGPTNGAKSDSGPDGWLPPNSGYRCTYAIRFTRVMDAYQVRITAPMKAAIATQLDGCTSVTGQPATLTPLPTSSWDRAARLGGGGRSSIPAQPAPAVPIAAGAAGSDPLFSSCKKAREAGYGPYTRDQTEYGNYVDGDNDGVACER